MYSEALSKNPLCTRSDLQAAMQELWRPLRPYFELGGAAATLGFNEAFYGAPASMVETFVRPLWGVAALVAGGGKFPDGELVRRILVDGVDPASRRYWGKIGDHDQRTVEMGSLAAALWLAPELLWTPLSRVQRAQVAAWLRQINGRAVWDNNWRFFRVIVNGALRSLGEAADEEKMREDLERLNQFYHGDGWYSDGATSQFDYYIPMAMHLYGLVYARLSPPGSVHAQDFSERARLFAPAFAGWFAPDGSALPIGRSLAYRFAQGSFWGALAFAGVEALPWGVIKHLHLQHLRWWLRQPIFVEGGLLSVGYRYPNQIIAEGYNAPGSPYWATKTFLPLALPETHPFWMAEETKLVVAPIVSQVSRRGLVVCRDEGRGHVFALTNNSIHPARHRHAAQKYAKFVYSTAFAFDTPIGGTAPKFGGADNMLLVSIDGRDWRGREELSDEPAAKHTLRSRWFPWPDVEIETWLAPALPGHVRVHRVKTAQLLWITEGGFPLAKRATMKSSTAGAGAVADNGEAVSAIWDLVGGRKPELITTEPNINLLHPLTVLPALSTEIAIGETWLFTAVAGLPGIDQGAAALGWRDELSVGLSGTPGIWRGEKPIVEIVDTGLVSGASIRTARATAQPSPSFLRRIKAKIESVT